MRQDFRDIYNYAKRKGFLVTGVDRTSIYLERATMQATVEGLNVEFVQHDMRTFCRKSTYDAVLNMYSSFGYFENPEDDRQVLSNVYVSLKKGGKLIMDMKGKEIVASDFQEHDWYEENGVLFLEERRITDDWNYIWNRWIKIDGNQRSEFVFSLRLYSGEELSSLLGIGG